ncbi:MAG: hypothetical protein H6727_20560 [Myxococcales bacterium]|nr:hypothetical protein [Myxococcales bacterium]
MPQSQKTSKIGQDRFGPLRAQLLAAVQAFAEDSNSIDQMLSAIVDDMERATSEAVEIFPVAHHSPAAAVQILRRLQEGPQPKAIFVELCEDLQSTLSGLADCQLPIALQAFSTETEGFPPDWSPLTVVAPLTEFSAEFQAIAYAMSHPEVELIFVDRSVDHIFQWMPQEEGALAEALGNQEDEEEAIEEKEENLHGAALGIQMGQIEPTFEGFQEVLLYNARVRHFSEWWDQYVESSVVGADYETYREVMCLVGSLIRRLGQKEERIENDRKRERYMWTRIKEHLKKNKLKPEETLYICGAAHAASDVSCFGTKNKELEEISSRTQTKWLYGLVPSSFTSIEHQFGMPDGTISIAENAWKRAQSALQLQAFSVKDIAEAAKGKAPKKAKGTKKAATDSGADATPIPVELLASAPDVMGFLQRPPQLLHEDEEQLLRWCVDIVGLARKNGYLASTADSIAIYQTAILLGRMRNRHHPSPYDFQDAAITCLEKDRTPKKRNIERLCEILLGGDRSGQVGYSSLPPLAQDVYDRLAPLPVVLKGKTVQRALMDFRQHPEYYECSDLLWRLNYLLGKGNSLVRPIMGERTLGQKPVQESWDISIGKYQAPLIQLAYEGVSIEQVLERRLLQYAFGSKSRTVQALEAVEDSVLFLESRRLTQRLGERANDLLVQELGADDAQEIFERVRRLVHFYRSTPEGLPSWLQRFVATGYSHFSTMLPESFGDRGTTPEQISSMLAFVFTMESLALSMGCERSQLLIAIKQSAAVTEDPEKLGILWAAEWLLSLRDIDEIRAFFDNLLQNTLTLTAFPRYLDGFLLALTFTPLVSRLVVELLSKAFERLPDEVLMPWLPSLLMGLRPHNNTLMPSIIQEVSQLYPSATKDLGEWIAPWYRARKKRKLVGQPQAAAATPTVPTGPVLSPEERSLFQFLADHPQTTDALATSLSITGEWKQPSDGTAHPTGTTVATTSIFQDEAEAQAHQLLRDFPQATDALATSLGLQATWPEAPTATISAGVPGPAGETSASFGDLEPEEAAASALLQQHPSPLQALSKHLS